MDKRLAVDIGGTFVDAVETDLESGSLTVEKTSTTPENPTAGVSESIDQLGVDLDEVGSFIHGTTLALNALLEREGAKTGIITNEGFRDIFELGRYNLPTEEMYNIRYKKPETIVPRRRRLGVPGRIGPDGSVIEPLDERIVQEKVEELVNEWDVESIAVVFLHAFKNPAHEQRVAEIIRREHADISVSVSSEIVNEHHEYERTSTTVLDAYIKPIFESYVETLDQRLSERGFDGSFLITRSGGGALTAESSKETPVHTILSGPAGGIIGATQVGKNTGNENIIAADMGGTSLDACVIQGGSPSVEHQSSLEHLPVMLPVYDIRTIGAGGGSIAWLDGELLKVGPKSAGAEPGPVCYGRGGTEPTVTDAALILGYLNPEKFLGGDMEVDLSGAREAMATKLADPLDSTPVDVSTGIFNVTVANTVGAIREITVERGLDPRDFSMFAYGGAGPMVIPTVARELGVGEVMIPRAPSVFSAWGMLMTDIVYDRSHTVLSPLQRVTADQLNDQLEKLEAEAKADLREDGYAAEQQRVERSIEMRYLGQEHTVDIPIDGPAETDSLKRRFEQRHEQRYGHQLEDPAEIVYLRVRGIGVNEKPRLQASGAQTGGSADEVSEAYCFAKDEMTDFDIYERNALGLDSRIDGPAIIREPTTTVVFHSDQVAHLDEYGHIVIKEVTQ